MRTTTNTMGNSLTAAAILLLLGFGFSGCATSPAGMTVDKPTNDKSDAVSRLCDLAGYGGGSDAGYDYGGSDSGAGAHDAGPGWVDSGHPDYGYECDVCDIYGWYGDGECDDFCSSPDPDCSTVDSGFRDASVDYDASRDTSPDYDASRDTSPDYDSSRDTGPDYDGSRDTGPDYDSGRDSSPDSSYYD